MEEEHFGTVTHKNLQLVKLMGVRRTGYWDKARAKLTTGMGRACATALRQATIR